MHARLQNLDLLWMIVQAAHGVCEDLNLDCGVNGILAQCMNRSHHSLLVLSMDDHAFLEYRCSRPVTLGVSVGRLERVLRALRGYGADQPVTITAPKDLECLTFTVGSSEYELKLLDLDTEFMTIPP